MEHPSFYPDPINSRATRITTIVTALQNHGAVVVKNVRGPGARAEIRDALTGIPDLSVWDLDGDGWTHGYLAGFEPFLLDLVANTSVAHPHLIARHEQSLKRLWPQREWETFQVPRDLTNTSDRDERTRFYHHDYQNKLLVGVAEFTIEALAAAGLRVVLLINDADRLPPTSRSLLTIFRRLCGSPERVTFVLLDRSSTLEIDGMAIVHLPAMSFEEFEARADLRELATHQRQLVFVRCDGDPELGTALAECAGADLDAVNRLSADAIIDLHLASLTPATRLDIGTAFVGATRIGDPVARRNAETLPPGALDEMSAAAHRKAMARYRAGDGPLVLAHALAIQDRIHRLEALVEPCEVLMGIGLYDTWFGFFAQIFSDPELRIHGSGDDPVNGLFINAAFVLYAMGYASAALPFLEAFIERFPESRFVPTALYAQSMTYGRYQVPVDLPRAEACATQNLALIDTRFADHPRYTYIKVFAENAYAYIKARQGRFEEALELCEDGISQIVETYGEEHFQLHRSILIYNTSQVYELVGDMVRAERRLREAIACDPYYAEYHNDLGNLLARVPGREFEAIESYETAISLSPPYYEAHLNRGLLRAQMGDAGEAEADFRRALQIKPSEWRALRELGNLKLIAGNAGEAIEAYDAALRLETRDADLQANAGLAASELGWPARAMTHGEAAVALNPKHAGAHNNLAAELVALGRPNDALLHAQLAAMHGEDADFVTNLSAIERLCSE